MCESVVSLPAAAASNHHEQTKTTTGDLEVPPQPTPEVLSSTPPPDLLPSPSPAFIYCKDDFRYCYDDDTHLQEEGNGGGADDQLLQDDDDDDDADQLIPPPPEERAPTIAAKLAEFARQKLPEPSRALVAGLGLVGAAVGGAYLLWPAAAAGAAAAGATMKAPGAAGFLISRAAFLANRQLYFQILRTAGAAAAAAAFAL